MRPVDAWQASPAGRSNKCSTSAPSVCGRLETVLYDSSAEAISGHRAAIKRSLNLFVAIILKGLLLLFQENSFTHATKDSTKPFA
mmetsp:Transcript_1164/g.2413  ORF Transcript_1164/g.2413 Transcript_1164/m.2413 type:complete len:85 (+) Transcript_1164:544-798(+)